MISSEDRNSVLVANFQTDKEGHSLDRVIPTVDIITHEQVVGVRWLASNFEEFSKIVELSMDVTTNCHRRRDAQNVFFFLKDFLTHGENFDDAFRLESSFVFQMTSDFLQVWN